LDGWDRHDPGAIGPSEGVGTNLRAHLLEQLATGIDEGAARRGFATFAHRLVEIGD
jgi:hypothetical protein